MVTKKDIVIGDSFRRYTDLVKEDDVTKALKKNTRDFKNFLEKIPKKKIDYAYEEGKWTVKQVLQHVIDAERVFGYRSLCFARKDATPLPGFDENNWAANSAYSNRKWDDLLKEFKTVRKSTEILFASFTPDQLLAVGNASGTNCNALGFGFVCSGHAAHHMKIIKDRYL